MPPFDVGPLAMHCVVAKFVEHEPKTICLVEPQATGQTEVQIVSGPSAVETVTLYCN